MIRQERLDDIEEAVRTALEEAMSNFYTAMPAIVDSVSSNQTISAQIALSSTVYDSKGNGTLTPFPLLIFVPLLYPSGGDFALTLPVSKGDEVLIVFASRCIDGWWQNGGVNGQIEMRINDLSDGFAIPGIKSLPRVLPNVSTTAIQLRNHSGDCYIEINESNKINIVSTSEINLTAPIIKINGQTIQTGGIQVDGIPFGSHKHTGVQTGAGNTGAPIA